MRTFALVALSSALLAACDDEEFARTAGQLPGTPDGIPTGALYAVGSLATDVQDFSINADTEIEVVYRLNFPAAEDIAVTVSVGTQEDIDVYNDANGLEDTNKDVVFKRYKLLPQTNYTLPQTLTFTVPAGETESAPLPFGVTYDENLLTGEFGMMLQPWMLPVCVESIEGTVVPMVKDQMLGIGIRPADMGVLVEKEPVEMGYADAKKDNPFFGIAFADCRIINPKLILNAYYSIFEYYKDNPSDRRCKKRNHQYWPFFDVECLQPLFISYDDATQRAVLKTDPDLMYVLTHQERYVDPQRKLRMKVCVSVETEARSVGGLCNLTDESREALVWQIAEFVRKYRLDGVSLNDKGANYAGQDAPAVDKSSYTKFLRDLRTALGDDKLILVSYRADENAALYDVHDGLRAGDYIDYAWWGIDNVECNPYAAGSAVLPIAGLSADKFGPTSYRVVDTPEYNQLEQALWSEQAMERYDAGEYRMCVWLAIPPYQQNFTEFHSYQICQAWGELPVRDGSSRVEGWDSQANYDPQPTANNGYYNGGLKDW